MAIKKSVAALELLKRAEAQATAPHGWVRDLVNGGRKATQLLEGLEAIALKRNPSETPEAHALRVNNAAKKVQAEIEALRAKADTIRTDAGRFISEQIEQRTQLRDGPRGAEIRSYFRQASPDERKAIMERAIEGQDSETLGALFTAPSYLAGMDAEYQGRMRYHYESKVCPDLHQRLDEVIEADKTVAVIRRVANEAAQEALAPDYVERILKDQAEAEQAQAKFEGALVNE